jgi:hypothetical protein
MADNQEPKPTQRTPKGLEIPIPERKDVMRDFQKAFRPDQPSEPGSRGGWARLRLKDLFGSHKER